MQSHNTSYPRNSRLINYYTDNILCFSCITHGKHGQKHWNFDQVTTKSVPSFEIWAESLITHCSKCVPVVSVSFTLIIFKYFWVKKYGFLWILVHQISFRNNNVGCFPKLSTTLTTLFQKNYCFKTIWTHNWLTNQFAPF